MVWFKVDDTFAFHEKCVAAGNPAVGLWVRAGSWCAQQLNDGFVPDHMIASLGTKGQAARLVAVNLWHREDGGFRFHQWGEDGRQPTREEVEEKRREWREKKRNQRRNSAGQFDSSPAVSLGDTPGDSRESPTVPSRPVPSRPLEVEELEGGLTSVEAPDSDDPPRCSKHRHTAVADLPNCWACGHLREEWNRARQEVAEAVVRETKTCLVHALDYTRVCPGCRADEIAASDEESA